MLETIIEICKLVTTLINLYLTYRRQKHGENQF